VNEQQTLSVLGRVGMIITNSHVVHTSDKHGSAYIINKDALYPHVRETSMLCLEIAERFADDKVEAVIAPAVGGAILAQWVAYHLIKITGRDIPGVYVEKEMTSFRHPDSIGKMELPIKSAYEETGRFAFKQGCDQVITGKRVLVVGNVLITGDSVRKTVSATHNIDANIIGLGVLCNCGGVFPAEYLNVPRLEALANVNLETWNEEDCPLCKQGVPINPDVGYGRMYLGRRAVTQDL